ncbi:polyketide cyclase [Candidatus Woesearchaeota archaeon CG10_big_fil_rev_8_21_14_0_10_37_12]|nr:MAG: polyketide cyclase [Candidatus Woesearchaeota archaeon CG10_big_fil_rev_8_21_14_0_10_37_12]
MQLVVKGKIDEAYKKYVDMTGKHHNVYFPKGFPVLQVAMKESHAELPNKKLIIKNILGDGDLVAVHSRLVRSKDELDISVVHLFRFKKGKIVEMWDTGQAIPSNCPNKDGAF